MVYTSARKKTVTRCLCVRKRREDVAGKRNRTAKTRRNAPTSRAEHSIAAPKSGIQKTAVKYAFFARRQFGANLSTAIFFCPLAGYKVCAVTRREAADMLCKKFARKSPRNGVDKPKSIKNERIGCE
ncbi:hypothetical protein [Undibacter mobilis]|uniref:hypothetical protein n=1 Tax=Undibacter mobilis TaxID=2292256 RepID=UPI0011C05C8F|nr:hypothetical protein [Undibacter mobilis]